MRHHLQQHGNKLLKFGVLVIDPHFQRANLNGQDRTGLGPVFNTADTDASIFGQLKQAGQILQVHALIWGRISWVNGGRQGFGRALAWRQL